MAEAKKSTRSVLRPAQDSGQAVDKLVEEIGQLSVLELSELVGKLQDKLGVTPQMAPSPPGQVAATQSGGEAEKPETKTTVTVVLADSGSNKIGVIKALREINPQLGLKEAKDITEATPKNILENVKMEEAKLAVEKLETAGAKVELK